VAGAIAVLKRGSKPCVAMMLDPYGKWTCPKGRIEEGETAEEAAIREAREELRLTGLRLLGRAGKARYRFKEGTKEIAVAADWFILVAQRPQRLHRSAEAVKAEWVDLEEAVRRAGYSNVRLMLRRTARLLPK
jgi:diadenosine hexaphosphate hydrolase (ATP-forming)